MADASVALRVMFLARALGAGASTTWGMLFGRADVTTNEVTTNEVLLKNALILQGDLLDRKRGREQAMQDMVADLEDKLKSEKRLKTEATDTLEETEELVDGLLKENNHLKRELFAAQAEAQGRLDAMRAYVSNATTASLEKTLELRTLTAAKDAAVAERDTSDETRKMAQVTVARTECLQRYQQTKLLALELLAEELLSLAQPAVRQIATLEFAQFRTLPGIVRERLPADLVQAEEARPNSKLNKIIRDIQELEGDTEQLRDED